MKWINLICILGLFLSVAHADPRTYSHSNNFFTNYIRSSDIESLKPSDRPVPFPWGAETEFPWDAIPGTWVVKDKDFETIYTIRVLKDNATKTRRVFIRQYDSETCDLVASGQGGVDSRTAWITMTNSVSRYPYYMMGIRSFNETSMVSGWERFLDQTIPVKEIDGKVYVFSIQPYANARQNFYLAAARISRRTDINCQ